MEIKFINIKRNKEFVDCLEMDNAKNVVYCVFNYKSFGYFAYIPKGLTINEDTELQIYDKVINLKNFETFEKYYVLDHKDGVYDIREILYCGDENEDYPYSTIVDIDRVEDLKNVINTSNLFFAYKNGFNGKINLPLLDSVMFLAYKSNDLDDYSDSYVFFRGDKDLPKKFCYVPINNIKQINNKEKFKCYRYNDFSSSIIYEENCD